MAKTSLSSSLEKTTEERINFEVGETLPGDLSLMKDVTGGVKEEKMQKRIQAAASQANSSNVFATAPACPSNGFKWTVCLQAR